MLFPFSPGARQIYDSTRSETTPYHAVPSIIAINMIMAVAAGGTTAVIIAVWVQVTTITSVGDKIKITPQEVVYKFTYEHIVEATYISVSKFEAMLCCANPTFVVNIIKQKFNLLFEVLQMTKNGISNPSCASKK